MFPTLPKFELPCVRVFGVQMSGDCPNLETEDPDTRDPESETGGGDTEEEDAGEDDESSSSTATATASSDSEQRQHHIVNTIMPIRYDYRD